MYRQFINLMMGSSVNEAFQMTIDTTNAGSASDTFILRCGNIGTYNAVIDWGDSTTSDITSWNDADLTHVYSVGGTYQISITGELSWINYKNIGDKLKVISIDNWGSNQWLSMQEAYLGCTNMLINAVDTPDFSLCTSFYRAFRDCPIGSLVGAENWNMSSATQINSIFENTSIIGHLNLSGWDLTSCTLISNASFTFISNSNVTSIDFSNWTLRTLGTTITNFISNCDSLTTVTGINTWQNTNLITSLSNFISGNALLSSLDFSGMDLSGVTTFLQMFYINANLSDIDVSNITLNSIGNVSMQNMFYLNNNGGICNVVGLDTLDITKVNNLSTFLNSTKITTVEYDKLLIAWDTLLNVTDGLSAGFGAVKYTGGGAAETSRDNLISTDFWTITDGGSI